MTIQIPKTSDEISSDWLNLALAEGNHLGSSRVVQIETAMAATQGTTSTLLRVKIVLDSAVNGFPETIMVKLAPESSEVLARFTKLGMYSREIGFYRDIPDPGLSVPKCYYAAQDNSGHFVLLLEDLGIQRKFQGAQDFEAALQQIAGVHAKFWGGEELKGFDWCGEAGRRSLITARIEELRMRGKRLLSAQAKDLVPNYIIDFLLAWVENYHLLLDFVPVSPPTLTHGDFNAGQLFIPEDKRRGLWVVDWQTARLNSGAVDVACLIIGGLGAGRIPRDLENKLIEFYWNQLTNSGIQSFPRSDFELDYCFHLCDFLEIFVSHTLELAESERGWMQPFIDGLVWSVDSHHAIKRMHEYLGW
jgi:hypothetical protein